MRFDRISMLTTRLQRTIHGKEKYVLQVKQFSLLRRYPSSSLSLLSNTSTTTKLLQFNFFSSSSSSSSSSLSTFTNNTCCRPIIELCEDIIHPKSVELYLQTTDEVITKLRTKNISSLPNALRFFSIPEIGGQLNTATYLYYYPGGYKERETAVSGTTGSGTSTEIQSITAKELSDLQSYYTTLISCVRDQYSTIWTEAPFIKQLQQQQASVENVSTTSTNLVHGLATIPSFTSSTSTSILEIRRYKLKLGYDTVPRFLEIYENGIQSKLTAIGTDPCTSLITVMYTEVGRLNEVIEIWRHGNGTIGMENSRVAARTAQQWRTAIATIASDVAIEFTCTIHTPTTFSPIR